MGAARVVGSRARPETLSEMFAARFSEMNRFREPDAECERAGCVDCGLMAHHLDLYFDGEDYRCDNCHETKLERDKIAEGENE